MQTAVGDVDGDDDQMAFVDKLVRSRAFLVPPLTIDSNDAPEELMVYANGACANDIVVFVPQGGPIDAFGLSHAFICDPHGRDLVFWKTVCVMFAALYPYSTVVALRSERNTGRLTLLPIPQPAVYSIDDVVRVYKYNNEDKAHFADATLKLYEQHKPIIGRAIQGDVGVHQWLAVGYATIPEEVATVVHAGMELLPVLNGKIIPALIMPKGDTLVGLNLSALRFCTDTFIRAPQQ